MAISFSRFALFDHVTIGDPSIMVLANGIDNVAWTDGLVSGRTEATLSTTAPDVSAPMTAVEADDGAGTLSDGTYYIYVVYRRDAATGWPSMLSGPSAAVTCVVNAGPSHIDLATIPVSGDAQVDDREIYILGGNLEQPFFAGAVGDNTTTTFEIESTEAVLQGKKILSEATGDFPVKRTLGEALPPKAEHLEVWASRLWLAKDDTLYFSEPLPKFEDIPSTNSIIVPRRGGGVDAKITQSRVHKRFLYVFYEDAVYVVSGSMRSNFRVDQILAGVGCAGGPGTVRSVGDNLYWLDRQLGPVRWSGAGDPEPIGVVIEDFWERVDKNRLRRSCCEYSPRRHEIIWYVTEGLYDRNNRRIAFDTMSESFAVDHAEATAAGLVRNELGEVCLLEGNTLGDIFQYDLGEDDGVYTGTQTGTPTTADGLSLADTAATFGAADDVEGRPIYLFDSDGDLLQANRVVTRTSATVLRLMYPMPASVSTYQLGVVPLIRASGPTALDDDGASVWQHFVIRYKPTSSGKTVYLDLKNDEDTDYTNAASFSSDGDGIAKLAVFKRGDGVTWRIRCNGHVEIYDVTIKASGTGGF